jgi:DNA-directed RNA polymerase specialized sigma24 family protein
VGADALPADGRLDLASGRDIERAANRLAARFLRKDDGAAFELLTRLTVRCLTMRAHEGTRRVGLAMAPETLVAEFMTAIFLEGSGDTAAEIDRTGFLAIADAGLHRLMKHHLARLSQGRLRARDEREAAAALVDTEVFVRLAGDGEVGGTGLDIAAERDPAGSTDTIECDDARAVFAAAFHQLARDDRRVLLLSDVDCLEPRAVACQLGLSGVGAEELVERAREALAAGLQDALCELRPDPQPGGKSLGDLIYELVKAALVLDEDVRRRIQYRQEPRSVRIVKSDLQACASAGRTSLVRRILQEQPGGSCGTDGLVLARLSTAMLERVEGRSARQRLANGVLLLLERRPRDAQREFEPLLSEPLPHAFRVSAARNLIWALGRQGDHQEAYVRGRGFLIEFPDDALLAFNMAVAAAHLKRLAAFHEMAGKVREICRKREEDSGHVERLLRFEVPRFADDLGLTNREVETAFGLTGSDGSWEPAQA